MDQYVARTCPRCRSEFWLVVKHPTPQAVELPVVAHCGGCDYQLKGWRLILGRKPTVEIHHDRIVKLFHR